jgi:hypothetical protein
MKKIFVLLVLMVVDGWAVDIVKLQKVHKEVLRNYNIDNNATKAFTTLQLAGIAKTLKKRPKNMSQKKYIHILNDFAFFQYESTAFKKNTLIVPKVTSNAKPYIGDERMQTFYHIRNTFKRLNRLCEAKRILKNVIKLDPERSVAYLNLGDVYWRTSQYYAKYKRSGDGRSNQNRPGPDIFKCQGEEVQSDKDVFKAYDMYKVYREKMIAKGKEKSIPQKITNLLSRNYYYSVIQDRNIHLGDDDVCIEYEKALHRLSDKEIDYRHRAGRAVRKTFLSKYNKHFQEIPFRSLSKDHQVHFRNHVLRMKPNDKDPNQLYRYKESLYIDLRQGNLHLVNTEPNMIKLHGYGEHTNKCDYELLNFKLKIRRGR